MLPHVTLVYTDFSEELSVVPSTPILVTLMMEALSSSETSVLTRATSHNIPEDCILHMRRRAAEQQDRKAPHRQGIRQ
jgi:hypothetical protein